MRARTGVARWARQRTSEAKLHARRAADKAAVGKHGVKEPRIEAPKGHAVLDQDRAEPRLRPIDLGVVATLKLEVRRQAKLHPTTCGTRRCRKVTLRKAGAIGNRAALRVLVSRVGCRNR
jgi:hypothetical protein